MSEKKYALLPADDAVQNWFEENIDKDCSASSAVYKFRLWLESLQPKKESPAEQPVANELEKLRQWKKEALLIINPIMEYAQGHKDAKLGSSLTEFVIDRCKELDRMKAPEQPVREVGRWISVDERPLIRRDGEFWELTEDGEKEFIAAVPYHDRKADDPDKTRWWIRHCYIDGEGYLYVKCDNPMDEDVAGWAVSDITFWRPLPEPPAEWSGENEDDISYYWHADIASEIDRRNRLLEENMKLGMRLNMPGISEQEQEATWQDYKKRNNL